MKGPKKNGLYGRIREILEAARFGVARTVNTTQVIANWLIGREIVEEEQRGMRRARYGEELIHDLAKRLTREFGKGYSPDNLFWFRRFFGAYPELLPMSKFDAVRQILGAPEIFEVPRQISDAPRRKSDILHASRGELQIGHTVCDQTSRPFFWS
jgi:hypothetical protein